MILVKTGTWWGTRPKRLQLSLFEKVILANSLMLVGEAIAGFWVTSHNIEAHHYLIDTSFIVIATLLTLIINIVVLRASFRPLFHLLTTIREITTGNTLARANTTSSAAEISELARAFNGMLDRLESIRQEQTKLILQAQEEERRRFALELHDEAGQNLTALLIQIELLHQHFDALTHAEMSHDAQQQFTLEIKQLTRLTQHTLENIRQMSQQLRPGVLDDLGLLSAFRWLVEDSDQRLHVHVDLNIEGLEAEDKLPPAYEIALFRIAQESLTNVARHAHTSQATIELKKDRQQVQIKISDNGCGYDPTQRKYGSGVIGMRERATVLKGDVHIHTHPGTGTSIEARLPLPESTDAAEHTKETRHVH